MKEEANILRILKETRQAILNENTNQIQKLSNQTIHSATTSQDPDNIIVAVLIYALSKIITREHYKKMEGWDIFYKDLIANFNIATTSLENKDIETFRLSVGRIRNSVNKISSNLRIYIQNVFRKARINKAFKMYEHGLSSEKTAELLGINLWELASYIGQSSISEINLNKSIPVKKRIEIAEEIFK